MNYIVEKEWLLGRLQQEDLRIVDCRFELGNPEKGKQEYEDGHIPGAIYFDLERDLSGPAGTHGGRHPMPDVDTLIGKLEQAGIDEKTMVVAYDNGQGQYAARFWWLLSYLGHTQVFVLNGGYKEWTKVNYPVTKDVPVFEKTNFKAKLQPHLLADINEVKGIAEGNDAEAMLIDSREEKRYKGIEEPIDKKKGHIPGAINKPWMEGFREGHFKPVEEQKQRFTDVSPEKRIIVYCGSGVTAAPNFLALREAGFDNVKLYLGSFSDWISYEDNEIE